MLSRNWNLDLKFDTDLITRLRGPAVTSRCSLSDLDFVLALDPGLDDARDSSWLPHTLGWVRSQGSVSLRVNIKQSRTELFVYPATWDSVCCLGASSHDLIPFTV